MKPTIHYVDALPGAGKTYSLHQNLKTLEEPAIVATPTNLLSSEQHRDLAAIGVKSRVISQETGHDNCTQSLVRHCEEKRNSIAIINHNVAKSPLKQLPVNICSLTSSSLQSKSSFCEKR